LFMIGAVLVFFLVILLVVTLLTRRKPAETQGTFEDWDFADYPQDF